MILNKQDAKMKQETKKFINQLKSSISASKI